MSQGFSARIKRNVGFVGSVMLGLSLVLLIDEGFRVGWAGPFKKIIYQYENIIENIDYLVEPFAKIFVESLSKITKFRLELREEWANIFLLSFIYLGSRIRSYFVDSKYFRSAIMGGIACFISLAVCIDLGDELDSGYRYLIFVSMTPIAGFALYDLIYAIVGSYFDRRAGESWGRDALRHMKFSMPAIPICAILCAICSYISFYILNLSYQQSFIVCLIITYCTLSIFWLTMAYLHASKRENRRLGESIYLRMQRSSAANVGLNIGIVVFSAAVFILGNAGLKSVGQ